MLSFLRRIPNPVIAAAAVALLVLAIFVRVQRDNHHDVPVALWVVYGVGCAVVASLVLLQVARGLLAADRGELDPFTRPWMLFFMVMAALLAIPIVWLLDNEPTGDVLAGAIMVGAGLGMAALVVLYMRKPVRRHGTRVDSFHSGKGRRWASATVRYGGAWRLSADPDALYAVSWMEKTNEICALRYPRLPARLALPAESGWPTLVDGSWTIEVLGWAENREVLDRALEGWEQHMSDPDGLTWVRQRLQAAATETEREKAERTRSGT